MLSTLNQENWTQYQGTELEAIRENLADSHTAAVTLIGKFTNEELFTKAHFPWTGTTSLDSYCVSATSSHYEWAIKKTPRIHQKAARTTRRCQWVVAMSSLNASVGVR